MLMQGGTPVYVAAMNGHLDVVKFLHGPCGCDMSAAANSGRTPLKIARLLNKTAVVSFLSSVGAQ